MRAYADAGTSNCRKVGSFGSPCQPGETCRRGQTGS